MYRSNSTMVLVIHLPQPFLSSALASESRLWEMHGSIATSLRGPPRAKSNHFQPRLCTVKIRGMRTRVGRLISVTFATLHIPVSRLRCIRTQSEDAQSCTVLRVSLSCMRVVESHTVPCASRGLCVISAVDVARRAMTWSASTLMVVTL